MDKAARILLYFFSAVLILSGLAGICNPYFFAAQLHLMSTAASGTSEIRCFSGGGMFSFGVIILLGLRCKAAAQGMMLAMFTIMSVIVLVRLISMAVDREFVFNLFAGAGELLVALACWRVSKSDAMQIKENSLYKSR